MNTKQPKTKLWIVLNLTFTQNSMCGFSKNEKKKKQKKTKTETET